MLRTNFYKIPIDKLQERIVEVNEWLIANPHHEKTPFLLQVLEQATNAFENRELIAQDPATTKLLQESIEVMWGNIPEKYNPELLTATQDLTALV